MKLRSGVMSWLQDNARSTQERILWTQREKNDSRLTPPRWMPVRCVLLKHSYLTSWTWWMLLMTAWISEQKTLKTPRSHPQTNHWPRYVWRRTMSLPKSTPYRLQGSKRRCSSQSLNWLNNHLQIDLTRHHRVGYPESVTKTKVNLIHLKIDA